MKNFSLKKALAAVAAVSVVSCATMPFVSMEASAADNFEISIDKQTLTLTQLEEMGYKVPIYVRMNEDHPGLYALEFGVSLDSSLTYEVIKTSKTAQTQGGEPLDMSVKFATGIEGTDSVTWMTWAESEDDDTATNLVLLMVDVPQDAKPGDQYDIKFRDTGVSDGSSRPSPLLCKSKDGTNYVANGAVAGFDGWILIEGAPEETTTTPPETTTTAATTTTTAATTTTTAATTTTTAATTTTTAATTTTTAATTTTTAATTTTTAATTTTTGATTTTTGATTTTTGATTTTTGATTTTTGATTAKPSSGTKATTKANTSTKSTTAQTTVASSPKTGVADILPIAGIAAAVAVLGGVAVVSKKKNDD